MPLPTPSKDESQNDYVSRCMKYFSKEDTKLEHKQQQAACFERYRKWKRNRKKRAKAKERAKRRLQESKSLVNDLKKLKDYFDENWSMGKRS